MGNNNVWSDEWGEQGDDWSGGGALAKPLPRGVDLGATLYELDPGDFVVYHFHHRWEELHTAQARTGSQTGERLWFIYDVPNKSD